MLDRYGDIWSRALLRCPAASSLLVRDWTRNAFRQIAERRRWSWLIKHGQFIAPKLHNQGKVDVTVGSPKVHGHGTNWDPSMAGRQFRVGTTSPIYTILTVDDAQTLTLDDVYATTIFTSISLERMPYEIYQCFFTPPQDFHSLMTVWDPAMNWQLWRHVQQVEINTWDAQRSNRGQVYVVAHRDYTRSFVGTVGAVNQSRGSGPSPVSTTTIGYTAPTDAIFTIECIEGGATGHALYQWKKGQGPYTVAFAEAYPQDLQDGVQLYWPDDHVGGESLGIHYDEGDVWVVQCTAQSNPGLPRYELWPHQTGSYVYPFLYEARPPDVSDPGAVVPRYIRGDAILECVLAEAARWPGPSQDKPNPYFNLNLAQVHTVRAERMIAELERQDDETYEQDVGFQLPLGFPYATPLGDSAWLQSHAI